MRRDVARQAGFTLVEVMVGIAVLTVGILGVVSFVDGASEATSDNKARESATALGRELLETARAVSYRSLTSDGIAQEMGSRPGLSDSSTAPGYTVARRGVTYTVTVSACAVDDVKDGVGIHDGAVTFCSDSAGPGAVDRVADDYRRVVITLGWTNHARTHTTRQTAIMTNPAGGLGPSVNSLALRALSSPVTQNVSPVTLDLTTSSTPASVTWSVNGDTKGSASGSDTSWSFEWPIADYRDGAYVVQAQAFDGDGRSGVARKLTVSLNRFAPEAPSGFAGGRNGRPGHVDLEWHANLEGDVIGYRVYRADSAGVPSERVCPPAADGADAVVQSVSCVDQSAPEPGTLHYVAVAVDVAPAGSRREGLATAPLTVAAASSAPEVPTGLAACSAGETGCDGPDGSAASAGTTVLRWNASSDPDGAVRFYRIYRDGTAYADRWDRLYTGGALIWVDRAPAGSSHEYRVSAVDEGFMESALSAAIVK